MSGFMQPEAGQATWVSVTGTVVVASAFAQIIGWIAAASATQGSIQIFASTTTSASATPVIPIVTTGNFVRYPAMVSGQGLTIKYTGSLDPNLVLFWSPTGAP